MQPPRSQHSPKFKLNSASSGVHIANSNTTRRSTSASDPVTCTRTYPARASAPSISPTRAFPLLADTETLRPRSSRGRAIRRSPGEEGGGGARTSESPSRGTSRNIRSTFTRDRPVQTIADTRTRTGHDTTRTCRLQLAGLLPRGRVRKAEAYLSCPAMITLLNDVACQCRFDQCAHVNDSWAHSRLSGMSMVATVCIAQAVSVRLV